MVEHSFDAARLSVVSDTKAPAQARKFVEERLVGLAPAVVFDVTLAVSEIVTNVVRHGEGPAELELVLDSQRVHVAVRDSGRPFERDAGLLPNADSAGGRGLFIVSALARDWGVTAHDGGGKTVWFEVALA